MELNEILAEAVRNEASDVLLKVGVPPAFRVRADFLPLEGAVPLDAPALEHIVGGVLDDRRRVKLEHDLQVDLAYAHPYLGRFRVNIFRQRGCLSLVIRGVVSQRLIPRADGLGMVPAVEVLIASARVREYIADKTKTRDLHDVIAQGNTSYGMQTFDQSLMALFRAGLISYNEALLHCSNPSDFELKVRGIASTSDARWDNFEKGAENGEERAALDIERF